MSDQKSRGTRENPTHGGSAHDPTPGTKSNPLPGTRENPLPVDTGHDHGDPYSSGERKRP